MQKELFEDLNNSVVLVTGATGLIGSALIRTLSEAADEFSLKMSILAQVRNEEKAKAVLGNLLEREDVNLLVSGMEEIDTECDYIVHAAGPTTSKYFVEHPVETIHSIVMGTDQILALAKKNKVKNMVYLSSMEEYGNPQTEDKLMTEEKCGFIDHLSLRSSYPEGKRMAEALCASYAAEYQVNVCIARLAQTFGPGVPFTDNRMFMQFARSAIHGTDIVLHTSGQSKSNFCFLSDAVNAILLLLKKGKPGEAYNVCNDKETRRIKEIAALVAAEIAGGRISVVFDIPESQNTYGYASDVEMQLCSDKLTGLGWKPEVSMKEAYERLIDYLKPMEENAQS